MEHHPPNDSPAPAQADRSSVEALQAAFGSDLEIKQRLGKGSMALVYLAK
jgi:hypothetical protein